MGSGDAGLRPVDLQGVVWADVAALFVLQQGLPMDETRVPRGYIVDVRFDRTSYPEAPSLALTLRPSPELAGGERRAMFNGVSDLRLIELNTLVDCCLLIEDVSQWQHEGVKYFVHDSEDEVISFKCLQWDFPGRRSD
jgi:hypothetical protein